MKSILVIGMGRFGTYLALKLTELGNQVMIADKNEETVNRLAHHFTDAVIGDCSREEVLAEIGVNNFDICFVTMGESFQSSLEVTSLLKDMGAKHVVSKSGSEIQSKFLLRNGADEVVYPEKDLAFKTAVRYNADNIFDFINAMDEGGFADFDLVGVSAGGPNDQGGGLMDGILWFDTAQLSLDLCAETGAHLIYHDSLEDSIQERLELYGDDVDLFVSIGGASPNCGTSSYTLNFPNGLVTDPPTIPTTPERGLNYEYAARGVPVVNLLNVRGLANDNGMTYDPVPFDEIGDSGVYKETEYNLWIVVVTLAAAFAILIVGWKRGREAR